MKIAWWDMFPEDKEIQMDPNKPEPAPKGTGREVTPLVIKDLELRSKMGKEKYGETLRAFNGRNALVDAYQEALDLVQYLRQLLEEQATTVVPTQVKPEPTRIEGISPWDDAMNPNPDRQTAREFLGRRQNAIDRELLSEAIERDGTADRMTASEYMARRQEQEAKANQEGLSKPVSDISKSIAESDKFFTAAAGMAALWANPNVTAAPESIAQEAHRLVLGDRGEAYGHPIFDMTRSADMLTALLRDKLRSGVRLEAEDIGQAMVCVKQSRQRNKAKRDNLTDTAGYALTLQMIAEWREAHPGVDPRDVFPGQ